MLSLQEIDPNLWEEFSSGNWVVNKSKIAFCALGAGHALEQVNRWMKVAGGIIGITQNQTARTRFLLVAPELARFKVESKQDANVEKKAFHPNIISFQMQSVTKSLWQRDIETLEQRGSEKFYKIIESRLKTTQNSGILQGNCR